MPAFDKNSVQLKYAYVINPAKDEEVNLLPCPRCGNVSERKHRSVCLSCKRRVPPMASRHNWEDPLKNLYAQHMIEEREKQECQFNVLKGGKWEVMRLLRKVAVNAAILCFFVTALPNVLQITMGEEGVNKMKDEIVYMLSGTPGQQVAENVFGRSRS